MQGNVGRAGLASDGGPGGDGVLDDGSMNAILEGTILRSIMMDAIATTPIRTGPPGGLFRWAAVNPPSAAPPSQVRDAPPRP